MAETFDLGASISEFGTSILGMATGAAPEIMTILGGLAVVWAGIGMFKKFTKSAK